MSDSEFKTRHEAVFARLRADILAGRWEPGQRLPFGELCNRYDSSVGVVREVLSRLHEQELVVSLPQQGYSVVTLSPARLLDLTDARLEIETIALRRAIADGDIGWESELIAAHHRLAACALFDSPDGPVSESWTRLHSDFHRALLAGCGNHWLTRIAEELRDAAELYRSWSVTGNGRSADRDIAGEHRALLEAALARDVVKAASTLEAHIRTTTSILLASRPTEEAR